MKRIEVTVIMAQSDRVREIFEQMELLYFFSPIKVGDEKCGLYSALIPDQLFDKVMASISEKIDLRLRENIISVSSVEGFVSRYLDKLKERVAKESPPSNPLEILLEKTEPYVCLSRNMVIMASFAALIALAGLFLDNVAIVIGAMLVSPLLGPINAFAVNATLGRVKKASQSQISIFTLLLSIIGLSALITFIISQFFHLSVTDQIATRGTTSLVDISIALILGLAGGLALFIDIPEILVGVAVAVALLPPAAVVGVGLALFDITLFRGALVLTFVNLLGLELGGTMMLRLKGVLPRRYYQKAEARHHSAYSILIMTVFLIILGLIVVLVNP